VLAWIMKGTRPILAVHGTILCCALDQTETKYLSTWSSLGGGWRLDLASVVFDVFPQLDR
jgi:hypothetical protein